MADESRIAELIAKQLRQDITAAEQAELDAWRGESAAHRTYLENGITEDVIIQGLRGGNTVEEEASWGKFMALKDQHVQSQTRIHTIRRRLRFAAAAIFIIVAGAGLYKWMSGSEQLSTDTANKLITNMAQPSSKNGSLILQDGAVIGVDPEVMGPIAIQGATFVTVEDTNRLTYKTDLLTYVGVVDILFRAPVITSPALSYNMLHVPFGTRYEVVLPDGTHAQVNAGSSLRFPVVFAGSQRVVELSGEAFFDVQKDAQHPFVVVTAKQQIQVLGTRFAVRSYPNEPEQTVILENGAVKVHSNGTAVELHPGQEARTDDGPGIRVTDVDVKSALCWKDGYFNFDDLSLRAAICKLAQYYGMKVRIEKDVKQRSLGSGLIAQSIALPKLLQLLELSDLHFEIHDSTIIVKR